jgi:aminomethyltransferase
MADALKRTPLFEEHQRLGGKIVPFAGYEMPVQYPAGIIAEHQAVRRTAGMFDVSHMGELDVRGPGAEAFLQYVTTNDVTKLVPGQAQYSAICRDDGGVLDDCIVYRFDDHYMVVVNASNLDKDRDWLVGHTEGFDVTLTDQSDDTGLIALQGPAAQAILQRLTDTTLDAIGYYHFAEGEVAGGVPCVISRTGYTGEDGFELYLPADRTAEVWRGCSRQGSRMGCSLPGSAPGTRSASRWATPSTATTWTSVAHRWRRGSPGSRSWTRAASLAATRCCSRRSAA